MVKTKTILELPRKPWLEKILSYLSTWEQHKFATAEARRLEKSYKSTKGAIFDAMGTKRSAICSNYLLVREPGNPIEATITLSSGRIIEMSEIKELVLTDGLKVKPSEISTMYAGRRDSDKLIITEK